MSLCLACQRLTLANLTSELKDLPLWWDAVSSKSQARGLVLLDDARQLKASASAGCPFCRLIISAIAQHDQNAEAASSSSMSSKYVAQSTTTLCEKLIGQPLYLQTNYDPVKPSFPEDGVPGSWHIRGLKAFVPVDHGILVGRIRLYAARDSLLGGRCDIIGRPPLSSSDSPEAFDLIQRWMSTCLRKHEACKETLSRTVIDELIPPILPSRVLFLGGSELRSSLQLIETKSRTGHYVALSHCWGPRAHRPPMTTESNLAQRLTSIPWDELPRVYQDAIIATRQLGFEYMWIDSLCIIQDSHDDWLSESKRMGDVYQHARLTIAASHASDSSQPCFFTRPSSPPVVAIDQAEDNSGSIFATLLPTDYTDISPEHSPLASRAWATQEWLLSRRMVFYTAGSLVWSCKVISQRETGASFHDTARNSRWKNIVEKYSTRLLTQQTDRLIALEGIRQERSKKHNDDTYCLGLWKNSMPDQLLWYNLQPSERHMCELDLPTWTWASTVRRVRFFDLKNAKNACRGFRFEEATKTLTINSTLGKIPKLTPLVEAQTPSSNSALEDVPTHLLVPSMLYALRADKDTTIGWCIMDEGNVPACDILCLQLMTKSSKVRTGEWTVKTFRDFVMILRPVPSSEDTFKRIGIGTITTESPWFGNLPQKPVHVQ